jgi:tight adherence protein C
VEVIVAILVGGSVMLLAVAVAQALPQRSRALTQRLEELREYGSDAEAWSERRQRGERRRQVETILTELGTRLRKERQESGELKALLVQAGYRGPAASALFWGIRVGAANVLALAGAALLAAGGAEPLRILLMSLFAGAIGWILPQFQLGRKRAKRMKRLQRALPDALDLLVICVEAGLGLNQAIVRVAEESRNSSQELADELLLLNLEVRSGLEREEAFRNLAERTGVDDIRALCTILIQTEKFGTSVSTALRTQADTMRVIRRQRAEEMAAKATIKIIPPLVFCIFPALFIAILAPAVIEIMKTLGGGVE